MHVALPQQKLGADNASNGTRGLAQAEGAVTACPSTAAAERETRWRCQAGSRSIIRVAATVVPSFFVPSSRDAFDAGPHVSLLPRWNEFVVLPHRQFGLRHVAQHVVRGRKRVRVDDPGWTTT